MPVSCLTFGLGQLSLVCKRLLYRPDSTKSRTLYLMVNAHRRACHPHDHCLSYAQLSLGPCQFPTLGFVVSRYNQVKSFVAESFWFIYLSALCRSSAERGETVFTWRRGHLFDFDVAFAIYEAALADLEAPARVSKVTKKNTKKWLKKFNVD